MCNPTRRLALFGSFLAIAGGTAAALTANSAREHTQPAAVQAAEENQVSDLDRRLGDIEKRLDAQQQAIDRLTKTGTEKPTVPRD
jgi:chromosome condensin MukBEF ATPase and DNA-binding subunit MukB